MWLRKELGQHLLVNGGTLKRIAEATGAGEEDFVLEIGPGTGNLTRALLNTGASITAVELDEKLAAELEKRYGDNPLLTIVREDILKAQLDEIVPKADRPAIAAGNLPYYISSPIIFRLLENREMFRAIVVLVQEEVGERMASPPGSRTYGMLSVFCQAEAECKVLFRVPRDEFRPVPDVDSCVVRLEPLPVGSAGIEDAETFSAIVRGAFEHRRKTCYNSLRLSFEKGACSELLRPGADIDAVLVAALEDAGIDGSLRPEQFGVQDYVALANHFARLK